jgi:leucine-zipper-like transcriptional regulator 1
MKRALAVLVFVAAVISVSIVLTKSKTSNSTTSKYRWVKAIDTGVKTWPRWVLPIPGRQGLVMIADGATWSSHDGTTWSTTPHNAGRAIRPGVSQIFFKDRYWLMGGMKDWSEFTNEVWSSPDAVNWTLELKQAPWSARRNALLAEFQGKLWLISGWESSGKKDVTPLRSYRDVWQSSDGREWTKLPVTLPDSDEKLVVFKNQLWLLGKSGAWRSSDGLSWQQTANGDAFINRRAYGAVVYQNSIWIFGGIHEDRTTNAAWSSIDGVNWKREENAPWFPRGGEYSIAFNGKLWIYGGKTGAKYDRADDVWFLTQ